MSSSRVCFFWFFFCLFCFVSLVLKYFFAVITNMRSDSPRSITSINGSEEMFVVAFFVFLIGVVQVFEDSFGRHEELWGCDEVHSNLGFL